MSSPRRRRAAVDMMERLRRRCVVQCEVGSRCSEWEEAERRGPEQRGTRLPPRVRLPERNRVSPSQIRPTGTGSDTIAAQDQREAPIAFACSNHERRQQSGLRSGASNGLIDMRTSFVAPITHFLHIDLQPIKLVRVARKDPIQALPIAAELVGQTVEIDSKGKRPCSSFFFGVQTFTSCLDHLGSEHGPVCS